MPKYQNEILGPEVRYTGLLGPKHVFIGVTLCQIKRIVGFKPDP